MDENPSDDETIEFDIEVVSSSSSASLELIDSDINDQAVDIVCDREQEEKDAAVARRENNQQSEEHAPPTRADPTDERERDQDEQLAEFNHIERERDKNSQVESEGAEIKHDPTSAVEQVGAGNDRAPPPAEGGESIEGSEHSNRSIDLQHELEQEEAEIGGLLSSEEIRATSEQQQCIEHEIDSGTELHTGESQHQADTFPIGQDTRGADNGAEQCDTAEYAVEQTCTVDDVAPVAIAASTVVSLTSTLKQEDDLTNNQVESPTHVTYTSEPGAISAPQDHEVSSPEGDIQVNATIGAESGMVPVEYRLIREPIQCPTGWSFNEACNCSFELADCKAPIEILPAPLVTAIRSEEEEEEEEGVAVDQNEQDEAECEPVDIVNTRVPDSVDDNEQLPQVDENDSQHCMVDISVRLDKVPDIEAQQTYSPAISPGLDSEHSQHSCLSHDLSHMTNQSSGHDAIFQQQMQHLHQQQVRRSSSAHLLAGTLEDEDLEREFDEEPEFEPRDVQVKRNQNPRDEYTLGDELGRGKFGTVVRCVELASGRALAAKFIHMRRREDREDVEREVAIMSVLQHKRLLQLYDAFDDGLGEMCLITELVEGGELFERIVDDDFDLTEKKAAIFMRQICEGVEYMHGQHIVHLDMKPENILCLSRTGNRIKLIDFGLARRLDPQKPTRVMFGTPDFAAPEVLGYETVTLATDMWSVGVICYVLLSGLSPFMGDCDMETMANVMRATFDYNDSAFEAISDLAKDFISKLLVRNPNERLRPSECLKHAWLARGGIPLEAAIRSRRESSAVMISAHHRLALEQAAMLAAVAAAAAAAAAGGDGQQLHTDSPQTPPVVTATGPFASRASFGAESSASSGGMYSLDKRRLKKYVVRRKWHKTVHAIMALGRMGANLRI